MDTATALTVAIIGFAAVCFGHVVAGLIRDSQERAATDRRSKQLIAGLVHEQFNAIKSLVAIESMAKSGAGVTASDVRVLAKPVLLDHIKLSDPVNPVALGTVVKTYHYIERFLITNSRDQENKENIEFDDVDIGHLQDGIDMSICEYIALSRMKKAVDPFPELEASPEDIQEIRQMANAGLPMIVDGIVEKLGPEPNE